MTLIKKKTGEEVEVYAVLKNSNGKTTITYWDSQRGIFDELLIKHFRPVDIMSQTTRAKLTKRLTFEGVAVCSDGQRFETMAAAINHEEEIMKKELGI